MAALLVALCACAALVVPARCSTPVDTHYVAAVVDFAAPILTGKSAFQNMMDNIDAAGALMKQAAEQGADIIVFAEDGLQGFGNRPLPLVVPTPQEGSTPCNSIEGAQAPLRELSCLASTHNMYLVVNLVDKQPCAPGDRKCLARGSYRFNTNVVFDRNGMVVAKYHKYHLYGESYDDAPPTVEYVTFNTDFGVRFGMFICFDIMFDKPAAALVRQRNVSDIIFSAAWFSEVPFLTAVQAHSGWAHALDATVLASGMNCPAVGSTGSGIYRGRHGILSYTMNWRGEHTLLVSRVPKRGHWDDDDTPPQPPRERLDPLVNYANGSDPYPDVSHLRVKRDNMTMYQTKLLPRPEKDETVETNGEVCDGAFCCRYFVKARGVALFQPASATEPHVQGDAATSGEKANKTTGKDFDGFRYRVVALSGVRGHAKQAGGMWGLQVCGLVSCLSEDVTSCGATVPGLDSPSIKWTEFQTANLTAEFQDEDTLQFPSTLAGPRYDPLPSTVYHYLSDLTADTRVRRVSLSLKQPQPLLDLRTFAIFGRNFAWDGHARPKSSFKSREL